MPSKSAIAQRLIERAEQGPFRKPYLVLSTLTKDMINRDLFKQASAMAYVTLLSLIPSLVAIFCVLSLFTPLMSHETNIVLLVENYILQNLASGTGESVVAYLDNMIRSLDLATIGWSSFTSVLVTLILLLRQIEEALNRIWLISKARNLFTRFMYFWTFLTLGVVALAIIIGMSGMRLRKYIEVTTSTAESNTLFNLLIAYVGSFVFFFFLYKVVPNCKVKSRNASIGAAISALVLGVAGWGYGLFVSNAKNYQTIYGALAQLPLFLMWLYICWIIILLGAVLSWRLQEGFPSKSTATGAAHLDSQISPIEVWRNLQLKEQLPKMSLLAIYAHFQQGSGKGISAQDLGHALNMPIDWVQHALDTLEGLGFVVASQPSNNLLGDGDEETYFPTFPAEKLDFARIDETLKTPRDEWIGAWIPDLPEHLQSLLKRVTSKSDITPQSTISSLFS